MDALLTVCVLVLTVAIALVMMGMNMVAIVIVVTMVVILLDKHLGVVHVLAMLSVLVEGRKAGRRWIGWERNCLGGLIG